MRTTVLATLLICLSSSVEANTFIVDQSGSPGTDFLDLPEAVASTSVIDGDTLIVRGGIYTGFDTDKALSVVELAAPVFVVGPIIVHDIAAGLRFSMEHLEFDDLSIENCGGVIILEGQACETLRITDGADVRVRDLMITVLAGADATDGKDALIVSGTSRVELVECALQGGRGGDAWFIDAGNGGSGVLVEDDSKVHLALCAAAGGDGGDQYHPEFGACAGDGGWGVLVETNAELIVSGSPTNLIVGGQGGIDTWGTHYDGVNGGSLGNNGSARVSGVTCAVSGNGYVELPTDPDPVLTFQRLADGTVRVEVHGAVGSTVHLFPGTRPILPASSLLFKPAMTWRRSTISLGVIGPSGSVDHVLTNVFSVGFSERYLLILQASVHNAGQSIWTNTGTLPHL